MKRYKKERVIYTEPYATTLSELRFLDGDAAQYIAEHTEAVLSPAKASKELPRTSGGGSYIIYRLVDRDWMIAKKKIAESFGKFRKRVDAMQSNPRRTPSFTPDDQTPRETPTPTAMKPAPGWTLRKPMRFRGYTEPLYQYLLAAHSEGRPRPNSAEVLKAWKKDPPYEIKEVADDLRGFTYYGTGAYPEREVRADTLGRRILDWTKPQ